MSAEASRRFRANNPDYNEREKQRMRAKRAAFTPDDYAAERDRIADYRARQPARDYLTNLRSKRRRHEAQREEPACES
jgi:hypothetical protein